MDLLDPISVNILLLVFNMFNIKLYLATEACMADLACQDQIVT